MSESGQVFAAVFYCTAVFCIHLPEIELSHKLGYNAIKVSILFGVYPWSLPAGAYAYAREDRPVHNSGKSVASRVRVYVRATSTKLY